MKVDKKGTVISVLRSSACPASGLSNSIFQTGELEKSISDRYGERQDKVLTKNLLRRFRDSKKELAVNNIIRPT